MSAGGIGSGKSGGENVQPSLGAAEVQQSELSEQDNAISTVAARALEPKYSSKERLTEKTEESIEKKARKTNSPLAAAGAHLPASSAQTDSSVEGSILSLMETVLQSENFQDKLLLLDEPEKALFNELQSMFKPIDQLLTPYYTECEEAVRLNTRLPRINQIVIEKAISNCEEISQFLTTHFGSKQQDLFFFYENLHTCIKDGIPVELLLKFTKTRILNHEINQRLYLKNTHQILQENKQFIVENLFKDKAEIPSFTQLEILPQSSETHNRGKIACRCKFEDEGKEIELLFYYKPRSARMDNAVLQLFKDLNDLDESQKSLDIELHTYPVFDLPSGEGSIWTYIHGDHPPAGLNLQAAIRGYEGENKHLLEEQLKRLESICKAAGIIDLHGENLFITKDFKVILIDLECLSKTGQGTSLCDQPVADLPILTTQEKTIIDTFRDQHTQNTINRLVTIKTTSLQFAMKDPGRVEDLTTTISEALESRGYKVFRSALKNGLMEDFINCDVPYFVEDNNTVYLASGSHRYPVTEPKEVL